MSKWWKDPRFDDEGTYDYLVEELPDNHSEWSWYLSKCDDCGKERSLNRTDYHYFYCWDGWDSMSYTTCWKCHLKSIIKSKISKIKKNIQKLRILNFGARKAFNKYCKKHNIPKETRKRLWRDCYDIWSDKVICKLGK
jgi:hypothetical protein